MEMPISLDALRVLDAIDRRGSFAAAATEMHRVTSAVSYAVQKLEEDLGVVLFDREGHRARLTPTGRLVLERGRDLLAAAQRLALEARQLQDGWESELCIAVDGVDTVEALFPLVAEFHREQPATSVRLRNEVLAGSWEALESERADILIAPSMTRPATPGIRTEVLGAVEFVMVAAPGHPAARLPGPLADEVLARFPVIAVADTARQKPALNIGLLARQTRITVGDFRDKIAALRAGLGIGSLPAHRAAPWLADGSLVSLPVERALPAAERLLAWRAHGGGRARRWFLRRLPDVLGAGGTTSHPPGQSADQP
jgi:DNA-binding transcriptional LysR family regulator